MNNLKKTTTGKGNNDYDHVIKRVEKWMETKETRIAGCEGAQVKARIIQRIVEITNKEYTQQVINRNNGVLSPLSSSTEVINAGGLRICMATGKLSISPRLWLINFIYFFGSWLQLLMELVLGIFKKSPPHSSTPTILMEAGGGFEESDFRFVRFCREGPIAPLASAKPLIVNTQRLPRKTTNSNFIYTSRPLIYLMNNLLQRSVRVSLLFRHMTAPFYYLQALIVCPVNVLISRDLSVIPIFRLLDRENLIEAMIVTTSFFSSQPLWMNGLANQHFKLHMLWYSQNFIPKVYIGEEERSNLPGARHMRVDVHWVWSEGFKSYLRELGQTSEIRIVGPILWYLPEKITGFGKDCIKVAVFDITPLPDGETAFGAVKNYYSVSTIKKFVTDIVEICDDIAAASEKEVLILLKHKRVTLNNHHDSSYLDFLEQMVKIKPNFKLIDHQTNLFGLLEECHLSVAVPYTSTVFVAAAVAKPTIYYDSFAELIPLYEKNKFVHFAAGKEQLKELMYRSLT